MMAGVECGVRGGLGCVWEVARETYCTPTSPITVVTQKRSATTSQLSIDTHGGAMSARPPSNRERGTPLAANMIAYELTSSSALWLPARAS